jgi:hypothetical protein
LTNKQINQKLTCLQQTGPAGKRKKQMQSRNLKIESTGDYFAGKVKPQLRLKGYWLEYAGFKPGNHVAVYVIWPGLLALDCRQIRRARPRGLAS